MYLNEAMTRDNTTVQTGGEREESAHKDGLDQNPEALLQAVGQQKNRDAFIEVFEYFAPRIKSFLIKRGAKPEVADELAQETMLTVWNKAANFDPRKARASTWIYTIARNKHIDALRKGIPQYTIPHDSLQLESNEPGPGEKIMRTEETQTIADALGDLPEEQAELIRKSFFEGKSHSDIAKETDIPLGTIKSRIRMALEKLRGQKTMKDLR